MEQKKRENTNYEEEMYLGVAIHSQVRKIKREMEKIKDPSLQQTEIRSPALRHVIRRQRSRSPLGLADRLISVGNS